MTLSGGFCNATVPSRTHGSYSAPSRGGVGTPWLLTALVAFALGSLALTSNIWADAVNSAECSLTRCYTWPQLQLMLSDCRVTHYLAGYLLLCVTFLRCKASSLGGGIKKKWKNWQFLAAAISGLFRNRASLRVSCLLQLFSGEL